MQSLIGLDLEEFSSLGHLVTQFFHLPGQHTAI